jgi:hypothetical protein
MIAMIASSGSTYLSGAWIWATGPKSIWSTTSSRNQARWSAGSQSRRSGWEQKPLVTVAGKERVGHGQFYLRYLHTQCGEISN